MFFGWPPPAANNFGFPRAGLPPALVIVDLVEPFQLNPAYNHCQRRAEEVKTNTSPYNSSAIA